MMGWILVTLVLTVCYVTVMLALKFCLQMALVLLQERKRRSDGGP